MINGGLAGRCCVHAPHEYFMVNCGLIMIKWKYVIKCSKEDRMITKQCDQCDCINM